jgi:hypothetical protein
MKKTLFMTGGAALLAFVLVFSACKDAYNLTNSAPRLPGPANLKAVNAQEGVITLTWDPVYDAAGYYVYRKTGSEPAVGPFKSSGSSNSLFADGTNRYDDIVSDTNRLQAGVAYTYTVVAVSATSTSVPRSVDVVQNGTSKVTITPAVIPERGVYTVAPVTGLAVDKVNLPSSGMSIQISWDKNPNPGVAYKAEFGGNSPSNLFLSKDGTKVVWNYGSGLSDGERYRARVTAYYDNDYYKAAAPVETVYTHSDPGTIISGFSVSPVTLYNNGNGVESGYDVSVYWNQDLTAPAGVTYELYVHSGASSVPNYVEWTKVNVTVPAADDIGFRQFLLESDKPAYRQQWTYKLVARVNGEEIDQAETALNNGIWGTSTPSLAGTSATGQTGKKIAIIASRVSSGLYAGEVIEFYAAPSALVNSTNIQTASDEYLAQFTLLGELTKTSLESGNSLERTLTGTVPSAGTYRVIAVLKNGTTRIRAGGSWYGTAAVSN